MNIVSFLPKITLSLALFTVLLTSACKPKQVVTTVDENVELGPNQVMEQLIQNQFSAEWLDAKCRVAFDDGNMAVGASASIKMHRNEYIWMNVKKFGFEIARVMVTEDSVFVLDRINNEYAAEPLSYVEENYRLPASLDMLQQMILGNPVFLTTANLKSDLQGENYRLSAESEGKQNDFWFGASDYLLQRMEANEPAENRSMKIDLSNYADAAANRDFSYLRQITVQSREVGRASIELEFNQVEIDVPFEVNFSIPPRYNRR